MEEVMSVAIIELLGDVSLQTYAKHDDPIGLTLGLASYGLMLTYWVKALRKEPLAWANSFWDGTSSLLTTAYAGIVLGEELSQTQWLGTGLISLGIILLGRTGVQYRSE
jgi:multidrug transporter EmrE-like cation transporter